MNFQDLDSIKDRIAKLLRMAADASSPNEAAIAAERARKLMDKHQLDEFDIGNRIAEEFSNEAVTRFYAAVPKYLDIFAVQVAKYNDCQARCEAGYVTHKKRPGDKKQVGRRIIFLGYKSDVELAKNMFDTLCEAVNKLCKEFMTEKGLTAYSVRIGSQFKLGAFMEIGNRLRQMTVERDALTSSNGTALVVIKKAGVDAEFGETNYKKVNLREANENDELEAEARETGRKVGATIKIINSIGESENKNGPKSEAKALR